MSVTGFKSMSPDDIDDDGDDDLESGIDYLPSPDEIAAACAAIRAGWSAATESKRRTVGLGLQPDATAANVVSVREARVRLLNDRG